MNERQTLIYNKLNEAIDVIMGEVVYDELLQGDNKEDLAFADDFMEDFIIALNKVSKEL